MIALPQAHADRRTRLQLGKVGAALLLVVQMVSTVAMAQATSSGAPTARPNLILYFVSGHPIGMVDDRGAFPAGAVSDAMPRVRQLVEGGLVFTQAFSAATNREHAEQSIYHGTFPTWPEESAMQVAQPVDTTVSDPEDGSTINVGPRSLTAHLKSLGYRLVLVGDEPHIHGNHFPFERIASIEDLHRSLTTNQNRSRRGDTIELTSEMNLSSWISREAVVDKRPVCLVVHDRFDSALPVSQRLSQVDSRVGLVKDAVETGWPASDTLFLFTSMYGETTGLDTVSMMDSQMRAPLVVSWPGVTVPRMRSDAMISSVDLLPTIVELAGGTPPSEIDGCSFAAIVRGESHEHRDLVFAVHRPAESATALHDEAEAIADPIDAAAGQSEFDATKSGTAESGGDLSTPVTSAANGNGEWACFARDRRFKLVRFTRLLGRPMVRRDQGERFVDTWNDPREAEDHTGQPAHVEVLTEFRDQLSSWMQRHGYRER